MITKEKFYDAVGRNPERDDLERCNCPEADKPGHFGCGWCKHNLPVFECHECFTERYKDAKRKV